jgi:hypothetical protein
VQPRDPIADAFAMLHIAVWEFARAMRELTPKVRYPDDNFTSVHQIEPWREEHETQSV